jgi:hypothetical protein
MTLAEGPFTGRYSSGRGRGTPGGVVICAFICSAGFRTARKTVSARISTRPIAVAIAALS